MKLFYLIMILLVSSLSLKAQVSEEEFQALKALYNATGGDSWTNRAGWENINTTATKKDVTTSWYGISSISDGHVTYLGMYRNNLTGFIPDEIGNLPYLTYLNFGNNNLVGPLPQSLKNLTKLNKLTISQCEINGPFPFELFNSWPLLRTFNATYCGLSGPIPDIFESTPLLEDLWIYGNQLEGEIPPSINKLNLNDFNCSDNKFSGALPTLDSCKITYRLSFSSNKFSGTIPESYGNLKNLQSLNIGFNNLSGIIPDGFFTSNFSTLYISNNFFSFEGLEPIFEKINGIPFKDYTISKLFPLLQQEISVNENEPLTLNASNLSVYNLGGNNNRFKWFCNNVEVYSGNSPIYTIPSINSANAGTYRFEVTNTVVTDLTMKSENILVKTVHVNQPPTNITLSKQNIDENYSGVIGTLAATDPDASDVFTFSLVTGDGITNKDNGKFSISDNQLIISTKVDFESIKSLNILIGVSDGNGGTFTKAFAITVNNMNESPQFIGQVTSKTIDETAANGSTVLNLTAQDPENDPLTFSITHGNEDGAFGIKGDLLIVKDSTKLNYNIKSSYSITVSASDGSLNTTCEFFINLNDIPELTGNDILTFSVPGMMSGFEINNGAKTIKVTVISPNLSDLIATFTLSPGASSLPASGTALNFSSPQTIAVTSQSGNSQNWLVTVTHLVGKTEFENGTTSIYPNPATSNLKISGLQLNDVIELISLTGEVIMQKRAFSEIEEINLQNIKQGTYFIIVESAKNQKVQKIIKL
jgi:hypothetical protein